MTTESALNEYLKIAAGINKTLAEYGDKTRTRNHNSSMRKMLVFYEKLHAESAIEREVYSALLKEDEPYYKLVGAIKCLELGTATADAVETLKKLQNCTEPLISNSACRNLESYMSYAKKTDANINWNSWRL